MAKRQKIPVRALQTLAHLHGIQASYFEMGGRLKRASPETLLAMVRTLDETVQGFDDVPEALRRGRLAPWARRIEPVTVVWGGRPGTMAYYLAPDRPAGRLAYTLELEGGGTRREEYDPEALPTRRVVELEGKPYSVRALPLPGKLPWGYHRLRLEDGGQTVEAMVISAPVKAYEPSSAETERAWGVFLPLYALHSQKSWGAGNLGDFERLVEWVEGFGGSVVATLPLLAAFLDQPFDPSPYVPASRLFWNEFYLDLERIPMLQECPAARARMDSAEVRQAIEELRAAPMVDYRRQMALKRGVIEELARCFFASDSPRRGELDRFVAANPRLEDYAAFRAACQGQGCSWHTWPDAMRQGGLRPGDYDDEAKRYYLYAQWLVQEQMGRLSAKAREAGPGLYLDLPLGVHPDSYDVWRERASFALAASGGAPPDAFFSKGQIWGFQPLHPERIRTQHYGYVIDCLRQLMRHAGIVRIDHVMGQHRLFWIPQGHEATEGTYVHYHADEFYAILNVESHRHRSMIVGEDLGTVPNYIRKALGRHNFHRMYVMQFCVSPNTERPIEPVGQGMVASLNTHDTPTFGGFWEGKDLDDQVDLGLLNEEQERQARQWRGATREALIRYFETHNRGEWNAANGGGEMDPTFWPVLRGALETLAESPAQVVLVNLEDLWRELMPQNVPGTSTERPNWQRRADYGLEDFLHMPQIEELLRQIDRLRKQASSGSVPASAAQPREFKEVEP